MGTGRFEVELGALQAFTNDERTRSFLALEAVTGIAEVRVQATDCRMSAGTGHIYLPWFHYLACWVRGG